MGTVLCETEKYGWDLHFPDQKLIISLLGPEFQGDHQQLAAGIIGKFISYQKWVILGREMNATVIAPLQWTFTPAGRGKLHALPVVEPTSSLICLREHYVVTKMQTNGTALATRGRDASVVLLTPQRCRRPTSWLTLGMVVSVGSIQTYYTGHKTASVWDYDPKQKIQPETAIVTITSVKPVHGLAFGMYQQTEVLLHHKQRQDRGGARIKIGDRVKAEFLKRSDHRFDTVAWSLLKN